MIRRREATRIFNATIVGFWAVVGGVIIVVVNSLVELYLIFKLGVTLLSFVR